MSLAVRIASEFYQDVALRSIPRAENCIAKSSATIRRR